MLFQTRSINPAAPFFLAFLLAFSLPALAFYSNSGSEVTVNYTHNLFVSGPRPTEADAQWELKQLSAYVSGPLQKNDPKAGPKFDEVYRVLSINPAPGGWSVQYEYTGTFIVEKDSARNLRIYLPRSHRDIYEQSQVPTASTPGGRNPCIDDPNPDHMNSAYFWYFWNPKKSGCRLVAGVHYDVIQPRITSLTSTATTLSYPEYTRLPNRGGNMEMFLVFGADRDELGMQPPENNKDYNARNFNDVKKRLINIGFSSRRWAVSDFQRFCQTSRTTPQTIEEFTRVDKQRTITIRALWGTTSKSDESYPFHCMLNHAVTNSSIVVYNGHSGLGFAVFLQQLRSMMNLPFFVNTDQYQIFAFNGCSSYGYYNLDFFREKSTAADPNGTKNLEVITNGIAGSFYDLGKMTLSLTDAVLDWSREGKRTSYQEIINRMRTSYLTAVNGDEDNP